MSLVAVGGFGREWNRNNPQEQVDMARQYTRPFLVLGPIGAGEPHALDPIDRSVGRSYDEGWLQTFLFSNSSVLPIHEIEPGFAPLIPLCRELPTPAGYLDLLFVNPEGLLTLIECKLWSNPQSRREVVGQILDYAKELSHWTYDHLEDAFRKSGGPEKANASLFALVQNNAEELDEQSFGDAVSQNLRRGRFLLLVVGEGIREGVEHIADYLQVHAHLNFTLALVELALFKFPQPAGEGVFVQPRILAKTVEITRSVIRIEDGRILAEPPKSEGAPAPSRGRTTVTEQIFYETVAASRDSIAALREFLDEAKRRGLIVVPGSNSIMLKSDDEILNFGTFRADGTVRNHSIVNRTREWGMPEVGNAYLDRFAGLFSDGHVDRRSKQSFVWTVKRNGRYLMIDDVLQVRSEWLDLIEKTLDEVRKRRSDTT